MDGTVTKCDTLAKKDETVIPKSFSALEENETIGEYKRLRTLHQLQKKIVRKNMHHAMSPISAISGYLELMNMTLDKDANIQQLKRYREKIKLGINELNAIIEHLHKQFSEEEEKG